MFKHAVNSKTAYPLIDYVYEWTIAGYRKIKKGEINVLLL